MRRALAVLALVSGLGPALARADCGAGEERAVGVVLRRCEADGLRWSVVNADLAAADVGVRVSRPDERGRTVEAWAGAVEGAVAAIPGGPFRFADFAPLGLTVGDGTAWGEGRDDAVLGVLALDASGAGLVAPAEQVVPHEPWMDEVISGAPILRDGVPLACTGRGCEPRPRAAVGLSEDGRRLSMLAVEGWSAASAGVSDAELAALLAAAGAYDGLRVAEGATSVLWARDDGAVVPSSDGASRATAAFLGIVDRARGATGQLVGVVERAGDTAPLPEATLTVETTGGRVVASGGTLTEGAYFSFALPARDYVLRASLAGYRTSCRPCRVEAGAEKWCSLFLTPGDGAEACAAPPRGLDAGPWPVGDAGGAAAADAGLGGAPGGCAVAPGPGAAAWPVGLLAALLGAGRAARRRRRARRGCSERAAGQ
jgi:MYXO-CTERM domain-containing protein